MAKADVRQANMTRRKLLAVAQVFDPSIQATVADARPEVFVKTNSVTK
jgi:hypothetical protein